ncbi:MAG: hypothetical protein AAF653_21695, partial [Chloroflexota bacterium]
DDLTRDGIWQDVQQRCTYALTGDRIPLAVTLNGHRMGAIAPTSTQREIAVEVTGGDAIDYVELLHNNRVIHRWNPTFEAVTDPFVAPMKVYLELGWAERGENVNWQAELDVVGGELLSVEPRFRGHEVVAPQADEEDSYSFSDWQRVGNTGVSFSTRTWGNPTTTTASTQGMCFEVTGNPQTYFSGTINGQAVKIHLADLLNGPQSHYLGGFLSPAYCFHQAIPQQDYRMSLTYNHHTHSQRRDWYYVRVRQKNNHWAWSSPIYVEPA